MNDPLRIGIVGARRVRQGLGPYMAKFFAQLGAVVPAALCSTRESAQLACATLRRDYQIEAAGFDDLRVMAREARLDAIAIASPHATHLQYLELALELGLHVLCEKPFLWYCDALEERTAHLVAAFRERKLVLLENVQWPYTLSSYLKLHPAAFGDGRPVETFAMHLSPVSTGEDRMLDTFPHIFSMLLSIAPEQQPTLSDIRLAESASPNRLVAEFVYHGAPAKRASRVQCSVTVENSGIYPRPAGYAVNGYKADRAIDNADGHYRMMFSDGTRAVDLPDPMEMLLKDFLHAVAVARGGGAVYTDTHIITRQRLLRQLAATYLSR